MVVLFAFWCFRAAFFPAEVLIVVGDYAGNEAAYKLNINAEELEGGPTDIELSDTELIMVVSNTHKISAELSPWTIRPTLTPRKRCTLPIHSLSRRAR